MEQKFIFCGLVLLDRKKKQITKISDIWLIKFWKFYNNFHWDNSVLVDNDDTIKFFVSFNIKSTSKIQTIYIITSWNKFDHSIEHKIVLTNFQYPFVKWINER